MAVFTVEQSRKGRQGGREREREREREAKCMQKLF
jgi:hypothetical protein